jgi:hypothetical protein
MPRNPRTCGLPFPETTLSVNFLFSSPLLLTIPFNPQQQRQNRLSIDSPNLLSPASNRFICSQTAQTNQEPRLRHSRPGTSSGFGTGKARTASADDLQYNSPVNRDLFLNRFVSLLVPLPLLSLPTLFEAMDLSESFQECYLHHRATFNSFFAIS